MNGIFHIISTPLFWIVSAFVSVALSVIGNLLTPKIAAILDRRGSTRDLANKKTKALRMGEVLLRFDHPDKLTQTKLDSIHSLLIACITMLLALTIFAISSFLEWLFIPNIFHLVIVIAGIPVLWLANFATNRGLRSRHIAMAVERRQDALKKFTEKERTKTETDDFLAAWDHKEFGITYQEARDALAADSA